MLSVLGCVCLPSHRLLPAPPPAQPANAMTAATQTLQPKLAPAGAIKVSRHGLPQARRVRSLQQSLPLHQRRLLHPRQRHPHLAQANHGEAAASSAAPPAPAAANAPVAAGTASSSAPSSAPKSSSPSNTSQAPGGGPGMVWVNTASNVYHCGCTRYYGNTKAGKYMTEAEAKAAGARPDHGKGCGQ